MINAISYCLFVHSTVYYSTLGEGNGNPLQYSCLETPMNRGPWWATYSPWGCSRTRLSD